MNFESCNVRLSIIIVHISIVIFNVIINKKIELGIIYMTYIILYLLYY